MKFVATSAFFDGERHLARGDVVSYDDEKLAAMLKSSGQIVDFGSDPADRILAELGIHKELEEKARIAMQPKTNWKRIFAWLALVTLIVAVVTYLVSR